MPRSSTRHTREIQGYDSAQFQGERFDETNDFVAKGVEPTSDGTGDGEVIPQPADKADQG